MIFRKAIQLFIILLPAFLLATGCQNQLSDDPGDGAPSGTDPVSTQSEGLQETSAGGNSSENIDWGREVSLDEMVEMAKERRIDEIQWHVLPNILRAKAADGSIYYLRNENKGVDLRNTLLDAGVRIGEGGILFQHVF